MSEYLIQANGLVKAFSGVRALKGVQFELKKGEVVALLGENGAGKSTMVKIFSGVHQRDSGELKLFGETVEYHDSKNATRLGIAMIHQELNMCGHLSIAENIFLGREPLKGIFVDRKRMRKETREILSKLNIDLDPDQTLDELAVSMQQMVEIAKALSLNSKVLIMDEPTSALTEAEVKKLFEVVNQLKSEGVGIIYISHRLDELQHITDRITIMRDGEYVSTHNFEDVTIDEMVAKMVGREITEKFPHIETEVGDVVLSVKGLNAGRLVRDISFELRQGEIVGIAGLMGAGRTELSRALVGIDPHSSGEVVLETRQITINKPKDAIKAGIVLVPEDRKRDGLAVRLSIRENLALANLDSITNKLGFVKPRAEKGLVKTSVEALRIKIASPEQDAQGLSGGNQQKVVVAKWLARNFRVIIFDEPTRGIDVGAKVEIYNIINKLKKSGIAVLIISSELPEVMGMSDRILVMCDGKMTGEYSRAEATQEKIIASATRFDKKIG
ncbi:MAG: sugar ABC transporter ATP-binding protein [Firmicutes bacterium]|nr:sugar ABC transporter ATP-binding protein [Bacillota bacterium]MCL1953844.1 sugar ABC transporter ATP-binding protein [Bacillota bacterium]